MIKEIFDAVEVLELKRKTEVTSGDKVAKWCVMTRGRQAQSLIHTFLIHCCGLPK
jgi:hypothetical protein